MIWVRVCADSYYVFQEPKLLFLSYRNSPSPLARPHKDIFVGKKHLLGNKVDFYMDVALFIVLWNISALCDAWSEAAHIACGEKRLLEWIPLVRLVVVIVVGGGMCG